MLIPVILSGGAGTRLWPVSREAHPKPFIILPDGQSLLQKTFLRASSLPDVSEILTITNRDYYFKSKDDYQVCKQDITINFLLEPCGRNTAPAVALAALQIAELHGAEATMLVLPADHLIGNLPAFSIAVETACTLAAQGNLVTFGIEPSSPETAFGYIKTGYKVGAGQKALAFIEKPDAAKATEYLNAGNYYWNSGMFCFQAGALLATMELTCPDVLAAAQLCWNASKNQAINNIAMLELERESFSSQPDISIDYAVMEKADNVVVVPCEFGWSDIGSWNALCSMVAPDENGNRCLGDTVLIGTKNTFIQSEHHLVAAVGIEDLIIVNTQDAMLVVHKERSQDVRKVVHQLKLHNHQAYRSHCTVFRPWGAYTVLEEGPRFKIKRIEVKPGAALSLQTHKHRSEHWVVVSGIALVVNGQQQIQIGPDQSTYIPAGRLHRLSNPGPEDCVIIEVQSGDYLGEDDIIRHEDDYGRDCREENT